MQTKRTRITSISHSGLHQYAASMAKAAILSAQFLDLRGHPRHLEREAL
jgi:hypothetical protein